jgi:hypothetical protein
MAGETSFAAVAHAQIVLPQKEDDDEDAQSEGESVTE